MPKNVIEDAGGRTQKRRRADFGGCFEKGRALTMARRSKFSKGKHTSVNVGSLGKEVRRGELSMPRGRSDAIDVHRDAGKGGKKGGKGGLLSSGNNREKGGAETVWAVTLVAAVNTSGSARRAKKGGGGRMGRVSDTYHQRRRKKRKRSPAARSSSEEKKKEGRKKPIGRHHSVGGECLPSNVQQRRKGEKEARGHFRKPGRKGERWRAASWIP